MAAHSSADGDGGRKKEESVSSQEEEQQRLVGAAEYITIFITIASLMMIIAVAMNLLYICSFPVSQRWMPQSVSLLWVVH